MAEEVKPEKTWQNDLDGLADIHSRLSTCESVDVALARRVTALEEKNRGHYDGDDPFKSLTGGLNLTPLLWMVALVTLAPMVLELWQTWQLSRSSQS